MNNAWMAGAVQFSGGPLPPARAGARRAANSLTAHESEPVMADEGNVLTDLDLDPAIPVANGEDTSPAAGIISQYVKDLSVENPNAPESYNWQDPPQVDVQFNIAARQMNDEVHEIELKIQLSAKAQGGTAYIVDLAYCGLVGLRNLDEAQVHAFIYAEAPRILFPFARRVIADAVRDAGYPPLMLEPIDFNGLYVQQLATQQDQQQAGEAPVGNA